MAVDITKFRAARKAKGWSQEQLADAAGVSQTTIDKIENGRTLNSRFLPRLAAALEVPLAELDPELEFKSREGFGVSWRPLREAEAGENIPIYAAVEGGRGQFLINKDPIGEMSKPPALAGVSGGYAVMVHGESMVPAFRPGDIAIVNPKMPITPESEYVFYTEDAADDRAVIKYLLKALPESWFVEQYNPKKRFALAKGEWPKAHKVVGKHSRR